MLSPIIKFHNITAFIATKNYDEVHKQQTTVLLFWIVTATERAAHAEKRIKKTNYKRCFVFDYPFRKATPACPIHSISSIEIQCFKHLANIWRKLQMLQTTIQSHQLNYVSRQNPIQLADVHKFRYRLVFVFVFVLFCAEHSQQQCC